MILIDKFTNIIIDTYSIKKIRKVITLFKYTPEKSRILKNKIKVLNLVSLYLINLGISIFDLIL